MFDALGENAHDKQKYRQSTGPIFKNKRGFMKKQRCCALATMSMIVSLPATAFLALAAFASAQTALVYQKSPEPIERLLDAPRTPFVSLSPDRALMLIEQPQDFPTIAEIAEPRLRLAGLRFNPSTSGPSREFAVVGLQLQAVAANSSPRQIAGLPSRLRATHILWSPNGRFIAFQQRALASQGAALSGLELYLIDVGSGRAHRVGTLHLNSVLDDAPCGWAPDSSGLVCKLVPPARGPAPKVSGVPTGPDVEENLGRVSPAPTFEDMLKTTTDEGLFEYYATAQLAVVPVAGSIRMLPVKGLLEEPAVSPDGRFVLVKELHRPFSYTFPAGMFPERPEVVTLGSGAEQVIFDRPLVDYLSIANDAVPVGPREFAWRSDQPATVTWVEAGDGGDPAVKTAVRDRLLSLSAPFTDKPQIVLELPLRYQDIFWGNDHLAIVREARWSDRHMMLVAFDPAAPGTMHTLYEGSTQDRYHSPGGPLMVKNSQGNDVIQLAPDGNGMYFVSPGASPEGDRPFLATMPLAGGAEQILWRSAGPYYAAALAVVGDRVLIRQESQTISPNYFLAPLKGAATDAAEVTHFASPYAGIALPTHQLLHYKRADGVDLTADLWLPAGYDKSKGPLPTLMEAYPTEFKSRTTAAQVSGSPNRFPLIGWSTPIFFTQVGYAVLQNASVPIVGEGDAQPNDTYIEQLVASAKAAIDYGASLGVVDPGRVAVMGHSYGAFMAANLLAHSSLFRAGIARSGAYNRTLTPYGFQNEERTYWQAPETYFKMSPFNYADKIKTPILLVHGEADDNTGTYPIQSERLYAALKGQGATVRLVFLPLEAHGYEAHESLSHMLWEMNRWLDTYVKPPAAAGP